MANRYFTMDSLSDPVKKAEPPAHRARMFSLFGFFIAKGQSYISPFARFSGEERISGNASRGQVS